MSTSKRKSAQLKRAVDAREVLEAACEFFESGERKKSIKLFLKAASIGSLEAQVNLANLYDEGDGLNESFETARYWYKRAISGGCSEGAYNLGVSYLNRGYVRWARHWLGIAKAMGNDDADYLLLPLQRMGMRPKNRG